MGYSDQPHSSPTSRNWELNLLGQCTHTLAPTYSGTRASSLHVKASHCDQHPTIRTLFMTSFPATVVSRVVSISIVRARADAWSREASPRRSMSTAIVTKACMGAEFRNPRACMWEVDNLFSSNRTEQEHKQKNNFGAPSPVSSAQRWASPCEGMR